MGNVVERSGAKVNNEVVRLGGGDEYFCVSVDRFVLVMSRRAACIPVPVFSRGSVAKGDRLRSAISRFAVVRNVDEGAGAFNECSVNVNWRVRTQLVVVFGEAIRSVSGRERVCAGVDYDYLFPPRVEVEAITSDPLCTTRVNVVVVVDHRVEDEVLNSIAASAVARARFRRVCG